MNQPTTGAVIGGRAFNSAAPISSATAATPQAYSIHPPSLNSIFNLRLASFLVFDGLPYTLSANHSADADSIGNVQPCAHYTKSTIP
jgi:hypothetical protein